MKGVIFNELESMVTDLYGREAWDKMVTTSALRTTNGVFVGPKTYPDEDLLALVQTASTMTGKPVPELVTAFGEYVLPHLIRRYPVFVTEGMGAKTFLLTVDRIIHVEVRKLFPDAIVPEFRYEDPGPSQLVMTYHSPRHMCDLVVGLLRGVGRHFGETIDQEQTKCTKRGDERCRFELRFGPAR